MSEAGLIIPGATTTTGQVALPCQFQIGARVKITSIDPTPLATVHGVQFTQGKVHYLLSIDGHPGYALIDSLDVEAA